MSPKEKDRETCLCKLCENVRYTMKNLQNLKLIPAGNIDSVVKQLVCDTTSKACMYNSCQKCQDKEFQIRDKINDTLSWMYWITTDKTIVQNGKEKTVKVVVKVVIITNLGQRQKSA